MIIRVRLLFRSERIDDLTSLQQSIHSVYRFLSRINYWSDGRTPLGLGPRRAYSSKALTKWRPALESFVAAQLIAATRSFLSFYEYRVDTLEYWSSRFLVEKRRLDLNAYVLWYTGPEKWGEEVTRRGVLPGGLQSGCELQVELSCRRASRFELPGRGLRPGSERWRASGRCRSDHSKRRHPERSRMESRRKLSATGGQFARGDERRPRRLAIRYIDDFFHVGGAAETGAGVEQQLVHCESRHL